MLVRDLMSEKVLTFRRDTPLRVAASTLVARGVSGAPVTDELEHVLGVLSETDVLFKEQGRPDPDRGLLTWLFERLPDEVLAKQSARTVGEAMTAPAVTISPTASVASAARKMTERGVNRLPVVEGERLVGIVTRADLVRAFSRPDEEIRNEIADVIQRQLWIPVESVTISVQDGEVALSGEVETRTEAELAAAFSTRVPGVVGVRSELAWRDDDLQRRTREPVLPRRL